MTSISVLRSACALGAFAITLLAAAPATAQMYPGEDVSVNPSAVGAPYYPGALLPPGAKSRNLPPVHLHPPKAKHHRRTSTAPKRARTVHHEAAPVHQAMTKPAAPAPKKRKPVQTAEPAAAPTAIPFSLGDGKSAAPASKQATRSAPAKVASARPLPKITPRKGLTKQAAVLFDSGSAALSDNSTSRLNDLAFSLKTALANGADHVELVAYGGDPGDKSSAARRISLKRALAVREALIVDGVPANRIDVRALGGVGPDDTGATDRVDIFVKA